MPSFCTRAKHMLIQSECLYDNGTTCALDESTHTHKMSRSNVNAIFGADFDTCRRGLTPFCITSKHILSRAHTKHANRYCSSRIRHIEHVVSVFLLLVSHRLAWRDGRVFSSCRCRCHSAWIDFFGPTNERKNPSGTATIDTNSTGKNGYSLTNLRFQLTNNVI